MHILLSDHLKNKLWGNGIGFNTHELHVWCHNKDAKIESFVNFTSNVFFECGAFTYSFSNIFFDASIGRYTSIADNVSGMGNGHPLHFVTSHPILTDESAVATAEREGGQWRTLPFEKDYGKVKVGNDCWIGSHVLLKGGICIGDGAVVAAGSVVTKDVPPYAIAGGNPAKVIRQRFSDSIVADFLQLRWWEHAYWHMNNLDWSVPSEFLSGLKEIKHSLPLLKPATITFKDLQE